MAKRNVANLNVALTANTSRFTRNMTRAQTPVRRFAAAVASGAARVARFTKIMAGMGVAAAGAAAFITARLVKSGLESVDAIAKQADAIGESTENLAALSHGARLAGSSQEGLIKGLQRLTRTISEAVEGTGEGIDALAMLGLSADDLLKKSPVDQFIAVADAMQTVETSSDKVNIAYSLLGRRGIELINLMKGGGNQIRATMKEAANLGLTFNRLDAAKVEQANDAVTKLKSIITSTANILAIEFAPFITAAADKITDMAVSGEGFGEKFVNAMESSTLAVTGLIDRIMAVKPALNVAVLDPTLRISKLVSGLAISIMDLALAWIEPISLVFREFTRLVEILRAQFTGLGATLNDMLAGIVNGINAIPEAVQKFAPGQLLTRGVDSLRGREPEDPASGSPTLEKLANFFEKRAEIMRGQEADIARNIGSEVAAFETDTFRARIEKMKAERQAMMDAFNQSLDKQMQEQLVKGMNALDGGASKSVRDFFDDIRKRADEAAKKSVQQTEVFEELGEKTLDAADAQDKLNESIRSMPGVGEFAQVDGGSVAIRDRTTRIKPGIVSEERTDPVKAAFVREQPLISDGADSAIARVGQTTADSTASRESQGVGKSAATLLTQTNTILTEIRELLRTPRVPVLG